MEYCDLGSLFRAIGKKVFRPHGKWTYHTTYVSHLHCLLAETCFQFATDQALQANSWAFQVYINMPGKRIGNRATAWKLADLVCT